jgi:hypothetical protein
MKAEFYPPADPEEIVGVARWDGRAVHIETEDPEVRSKISRIFRSAPVVVDDSSMRPLDTRVDPVVQPGSLDWFRAAAFSRAKEAGLSVRLVPEVRGRGGWDPASAYRPFRQAVARLVTGAEQEGEGPEQPGETRPEGAGPAA